MKEPELTLTKKEAGKVLHITMNLAIVSYGLFSAIEKEKIDKVEIALANKNMIRACQSVVEKWEKYVGQEEIDKAIKQNEDFLTFYTKFLNGKYYKYVSTFIVLGPKGHFRGSYNSVDEAIANKREEDEIIEHRNYFLK